MNLIQLPEPIAASELANGESIGAAPWQEPEPAAPDEFEPVPLPTPPSRAGVTSPGGAGAALRAPRHVPATVGPFLANALRDLWESYRVRLQDCQDEFSEQSVHKLRVATRRLIAQLIIVGCAIPGTTAEKARRVLKSRLKAFGDLRDTHIQRLFTERRMTRFPELILLREFLRSRERLFEREAAAKVKRYKIRKLGKWVLALELRLARMSAPRRRAGRLPALVTRATNRAFAAVVTRRQAIDPASPITLHRTRIAFKKFRYMVESLSPDFTGLGKRELRALAHYQRRMGIIQDLEVMQQCIAELVQEDQRMRDVLAPFNRYLQASRARALRSFLKSANDLFAFWPTPAAADTDGPVRT